MTGNPLDPSARSGSPEAPDDELRKEFQALRQELADEGAIPDFQGMLASARAQAERGTPGPSTAPRFRSGLLPWVPLAAAAAAVLLLLGRPGSDADAEFERLVSEYGALANTGALRSPTESLLDIPGVDLGAVPSFGAGSGSVSTEGRRP